MWRLTRSHRAQLDFLQRVFNQTFQNALVEIRRDLGVPDDVKAVYIPGEGFRRAEVEMDGGPPETESIEVIKA